MFRRTKNNASRVVSSALFSQTYLSSNRFFTLARQDLLSESKAAITTYQIKGENEHLATHMDIRNPKGKNLSSLFREVCVLVAEHPNCQLTLMMPTMLLNHEHKSKNRHPHSKGYISPGHIHFGCTGPRGQLMQEGDASFSTTGETVMNSITPVHDTRLVGYQPQELALCKGKFTDTACEIRKWASLAEKYHDYPLYILARPFKSSLDCEKYLKQVEDKKREYADNCYALLSYYKPGTDEVEQASNCVTLVKAFSEGYFDIQLDLGDNPSPQTAYVELVKKLYPKHEAFHRHLQRNEVFSEVHYESSTRERYSFVV